MEVWVELREATVVRVVIVVRAVIVVNVATVVIMMTVVTVVTLVNETRMKKSPDVYRIGRNVRKEKWEKEATVIGWVSLAWEE